MDLYIENNMNNHTNQNTVTAEERNLLNVLRKIKLNIKISYYTYILELQKRYHELYKNNLCDQTEKYENLKVIVTKKFNSLLEIKEINININNMRTNNLISGLNTNLNNLNTNLHNLNTNLNNNTNLFTNDVRRKSELVNYDTSKLNKMSISIVKNNYDGETYNYKARGKFTFYFENFN